VSNPSRPLRVLIVEDDVDSARSLVLLLSTEGYEAKEVGNAKAMWESAGAFDPDIILLDITLPDASGYQVARDLRRTYGEESARPALIAVTAWNKPSDKILAQIAGFDYHVGKPYYPQTLISILRSVSPTLS
jgi:DNA-binding response OmpR family regulator